MNRLMIKLYPPKNILSKLQLIYFKYFYKDNISHFGLYQVYKRSEYSLYYHVTLNTLINENFQSVYIQLYCRPPKRFLK
jgi:hypothetical protein